MKTFESIALGIPNILLPKAGTDLSRWAVIACDQYTSDLEYWQKVRDTVGGAPSALNLIYPEVYLGEENPETRIASIREHMQKYLDEGLFDETEGFVYVERQTGRHTRKGLLVCLDLDRYDFHKGATSLIRATEGTILARIPPRVKIREGAPLEIPHIMVLIDDPDNTVIGPLTQNKDKLQKLYSIELMMGSGHLSGYRVDKSSLEKGIVSALEALADPQAFAKKYNLGTETPVILYAMGDGNHSFATAKTIWEKTKEQAQDKDVLKNSPLRYGLVELVNLHDEALVFEPIHRVLFDLDQGRNVLDDLMDYYPGRCRISEVSSDQEMLDAVDHQKGYPHRIGIVSPTKFGIVEVSDPDANLPAATLQIFLNDFMEKNGAKKIDYIHGTESLIRLAKKDYNLGFYLPALDKFDLFKTVILDGSTPRKTFSMGEAWEKRFYMEARKLVREQSPAKKRWGLNLILSKAS
ncbi:MAG: DUF1015 domain-containing protein [Candidatus Aminicenantes bacterium]|jgi:hypothetical protein